MAEKLPYPADSDVTFAYPKELSDLTPKQRDFVLAYIETKNGTEACRRAGYEGNGNVLGVQAHDNLNNPKCSVTA